MTDMCAAGCGKPAALMHKNVGYCVWDYRALPDTILSHVTTP